MSFLKQIWITVAALAVAFVVSWVWTMPNSQERGAWRSVTGGQIITLSMFQAKLYSENSTSCVEQLSFPAHLKLVEWAEGATLEIRDDQLVLSLSSTLDQTKFERLPALPETCGPANPDATPADVFDALWSAMDEHYAFFDLHGVDWDARRALRPDDNAMISDDTLFALLSDTLTGLDDGHVQLGTPVGYFSPSLSPDWAPQDDTLERDDLWQIARNAVGTPLTPVELTAIEYILLPDNIGYVMIREMGLNTPFGAKDGPAMAQAFMDVADALENADTIIIDLRYNPGGSDTVSFGVAGHFIAEPLEVFRKTTRNGDTQTDPFTALLLPFDDTPLDQPVIVLTSKLTGSAAEILTMAMREMPQVTVMGEPTSGGLSDILGFKLPNGWDFGLSHQTYSTLDGNVYEAVGIPPDVPFMIETAPLLNGEDPLLRAAFARARSQ